MLTDILGKLTSAWGVWGGRADWERALGVMDGKVGRSGVLVDVLGSLTHRWRVGKSGE